MLTIFVHQLAEGREKLLAQGISEEETEKYLMGAFELAVLFGLSEYVKTIGDENAKELAVAMQAGDLEKINQVMAARSDEEKIVFTISAKKKLAELLDKTF